MTDLEERVRRLEELHGLPSGLEDEPDYDDSGFEEDDILDEFPCPCGCVQENARGELIRVADCCW